MAILEITIAPDGLLTVGGWHTPLGIGPSSLALTIVRVFAQLLA